MLMFTYINVMTKQLQSLFQYHTIILSTLNTIMYNYCLSNSEAYMYISYFITKFKLPFQECESRVLLNPGGGVQLDGVLKGLINRLGMLEEFFIL